MGGGSTQSAPEELLKEVDKFLHRHAGFPNECSQCAFGEFFVIGDRQATMRWEIVPEKNMTSALSVKPITGFSKGADRFRSGDSRQLH